MLLSTGVVEALKAAWPEAQIDFLCQQKTSVALRGQTSLTHLYCWPGRGPGSLGQFFRWVGRLRQKRYDAALVLWSTTATAWLTRLCAIPLRVGQDSRFSYSFLYNRRVRVRSEHGDQHSHWSEILLDYVRALGVSTGPARVGFPVSPASRDAIRARLQPLTAPRIAFHPFKGPPVVLERWPLEVFAGWARSLAEELGASVIFTGSPQEAPFAEQLVKMAAHPRVSSLAGQTSLEELAALAQECDLFLCPDSGPMHVAAAAGARVLGVYAMEEDFPQRWAPLSCPSLILRPQPLGCPAGCRKPTCQDYRCYQAVEIPELLAMTRDLLSRSRPNQAPIPPGK